MKGAANDGALFSSRSKKLEDVRNMEEERLTSGKSAATVTLKLVFASVPFRTAGGIRHSMNPDDGARIEDSADLPIYS